MHRNDAAVATEPQRTVEENDLATRVLDAAFKVHRALGPGLLESAYVHCLLHELKMTRLSVLHQHPLPLRYGDVQLDAGYRLDLWVENRLIVEVKAVEELHPIHTAQLLTYLKLTGNRLGLLINFNEILLRDGVRRIANGMPQ